MEIKNVIYTFDDVLNECKKYINNAEDLALIKKAYLFANEKHKGQLRKSGDPYITHCLGVAMILAKLNTGPKTICAGLLHDVIEDTPTKIEEVTSEFSSEVAQLVEALTKVTRLSDYQNVEFTSENHRKIFVAMAKDVRVILVKLADRLHNMRTLQYQPPVKQKRIAQETLDVYAPIAHRLGLNSFQTEFEDTALYYLDRSNYNLIENKLNKLTKNLSESIEKIEKQIDEILSKSNIKYTITHRLKSIYSIYKKMFNKNYTFEQIYDFMALRIITENIQNCYEILGFLHASFKPVPGRFKDYIAMPKANMYQSLHTTVVTADGNFFEVQIRTHDMDLLAEGGVAAHWRYKEGSSYDAKKEQEEIENQLHWFKEMVSIVENNEDESQHDIVSSLSHDIFDTHVYVFTPKGNVICLPNGSTPIDFAFKIHSEIGEHLSGAKVNGILVPISYKLTTGDIVEVITNKNNFPNSEWINIAQTSFAKTRIRKFLFKQDNEYSKDELIKNSRQVLTDYLKEKKVKASIEELLDKDLLKHFEVETIDDLLLLIQKKNVNPSNIFSHSAKYNEIISSRKSSNKTADITKRVSKSSGIICLPNGDSIMSTLANCCQPVLGDEIVGFVTLGQGVKIHRKDCPNIHDTNKDRLIEVMWNPNNASGKEFAVDLEILSQDRQNLVSDILNTLNIANAKVTKLSAKANYSNQTTKITLTLLAKNAETLEFFISSIYKVKSIINISRRVR